MKKEGSLEKPTRSPLNQDDPTFYNKQLLDEEMARQFDVCHGCRRCFNLCGSFPQLFDLIDESPTGEVDGVSTSLYGSVVEECTLCDMCFMTLCPYVPPHEFNIDFPHLMLRYKAYEHKHGKTSFVKEQLTKIDRNNKVLKPLATAVNASLKTTSYMRPLIEHITQIDRRASVPSVASKTLQQIFTDDTTPLNEQGIAFGTKIALYATCYGNYHETQIGYSAIKILKHLGVGIELHYPGCCGMPELEIGNLDSVAKRAQRIAQYFSPLIEKNLPIVSLIPSCSFMLKSEWVSLCPDDPDVISLSKATLDICEFITQLFKEKGLPPTIAHLDTPILMHLACHARAQNMGPNAAQMLKLAGIENIEVIERCSGHGGTWGMMTQHFDMALKVGKPVINKAKAMKTGIVSSECPLAAEHIMQGIEMSQAGSSETLQNTPTFEKLHPLQILQLALGL